MSGTWTTRPTQLGRKFWKDNGVKKVIMDWRKWHIGGFPMSIGCKVGLYLIEKLRPNYLSLSIRLRSIPEMITGLRSYAREVRPDSCKWL